MTKTRETLPMNRILIDTNVLIYAKDSNSIYHQKSLNLFRSESEVFLTSKNLSEYYSVVTKGESPLLTPAEALMDLEEFESQCTVLYSSENSQSILRGLIRKYNPKGLRIHDFEIASIAIANGVTTIATFNGSDFQAILEINVVTAL